MSRYIEIMNVLTDEIESGKYRPGGLLPTEKELSKRFNSSVTTIRSSLKGLLDKGYIYKRQGSGTYVKENNGTAFHNVPGKILNIGIIINLKPKTTEVQFLTEPTFLQKLSGVRKILRECGANLTLSTYDYSSEEPWREIESGFKPDGFIDLGFTTSDRLAEYFVSRKCKVVAVTAHESERRYKHPFPLVVVNHHDAMCKAVGHYQSQGLRRFGYIALAENGLANFRIFEKAFKQENAIFDMESVIIHPESTSNINNFQRRIAQIGRNIVNNSVKPDVFFFDGGAVAEGMSNFFMELGNGFDRDIKYCVIGSPETSNYQTGIKPDLICPSFEKAGEEAAGMILKKIRQDSVDFERIDVPSVFYPQNKHP